MKKLSTLFLFMLFLFGACAHAAPPIITNNQNLSLAPTLKKVLPAVVNIAVRGELPPILIPDKRANGDGDTGMISKFEGIGSGVIVDATKGYVLTNTHVVKDAQVITITLNDGRRLHAKIIGYDIPSDVAVIQIKAKRLTAIPFSDSDKLKVGDFVAAIGNPFGLQHTVTSGVISALERTHLGIEGHENFIQTDASVNPGNSGGALVNLNGELVGINTAALSTARFGGSIGLNFAIPSNMAKSVMEQLITYGNVKRGIFGVTVQDITPALAETMHLPNNEGALISQVLPNTPADKAQVKIKDVIINVMGKPMRSAAQVTNTISLLRAGTKFDLQIWRDNKTINISTASVDLDEVKQNMENAPKALLWGLQLRNFDQLLNNQQVKGVEVLDMDDTSVAYSSGLRPGDIIIAAANQPIQTIEALQNIVQKNPEQLLLEVQRGLAGMTFLVLEQ